MSASDHPDTSAPTSRLIPTAVLESAKAKIVSAAADLAPYLESVDETRRRHMRRVSPRDRAGVQRAEAIARANPRYRPGFLVMDDFSASLANTDGLEDLRDPLATLAARVNDTLLVEESNATNSASAVYKLIQVAAKLKDPEAQAAEADLASRMVRRGRPRQANRQQEGGATGGNVAAPARLSLPRPVASDGESGRG